MSQLRPQDAERLFERVRCDVGRDRGARGWLRSRPTPQRALWIGLTSLTLSLGLTWLVAGGERVITRSSSAWVGLLGLVAVQAAAFAVMLRPLWLPAWSGSARRLLLVGLGLAALASIGLSGDGTLGSLGNGHCLLIGLVVGGAAFAFALGVDRQPRRMGVFRALGAGLVGTLAVQLLCPHGGLAHILGEHAGVAALATAIFAAIGLRLERVSRA